MKVRLSILIPLLLIMSSLVSSTLLFRDEIRLSRQNIEQEGISDINVSLTHLQNILDTQLAAGNLQDARLSLAVTALHPGIQTLLFADDHDMVMLAHRFLLVGNRAAKVSAYDENIARQVRRNGTSSVSINQQRSLLSGYYPVTLRIAAGGLAADRIGILFVEYDLAPKLAEARRNAIVHAFAFGGMMIAVAVVVAILLHWLVSRRLKKIVDASKRFATGDLDARVHLHGGDELAQLGHAFDYMAGQRKEAQEALRHVNEYNRSLIEASPDPLVTISVAGKITDVNRATEKVTGKSRAQLIGTDFSDYFTEPERARQGYQQVFARGAVTDYPLSLRHRDGHVTDVLYNASVYRNEAGDVLGAFAAARDITERKRAEAARLELAAIVESSSDAIIGKTPDGIITSWNKSAEAIYGYSIAEIIGKPITMLAQPARHAEIREILEAVRNGGTVANHETERIRKDGTLIHVALTLSPIRDAAGHITGISTIARDITEKKRMEEKLRQSSVYNRSLIEASLDPLVTISAEGKVTDVNQATERITGRTRTELIGTDFSVYFTEPERARAGYRQVFKQGFVTDYPLALRHRDGHISDVLYNASLYRSESGEVLGVFAAARDISDLKRTEERLRRSEHGLAEAQRIAHLGNWELDLLNNKLTWSDEIYRIFEIDPSKFGASYEAFLNGIHPDDREMVNNAYTESVRTRTPYNIEHRLLMKDGRVKYVNEICETYYDQDGKPLRSIGTVHDITERKLDEEAMRRLNRELRAISNCNQTLMRAEDEQALLDKICHIVCDDAGYRMAWVGFPEEDEARSIRVVSWAGAESGYLAEAKLTWADTERGHGPSGIAIRTGDSVSIQDFSADPKAAPWRDAALQRGYRSSISLPLKDESAKVFGIFNIYADTPHAFTPAEVRLLEELAGDMAFGIMVLRVRIERRRAEEGLRRMNERFALATRAGHLGVWDWDLEKNHLVWDDRMYELYGVRKEDFSGAYDAWLSGLHPDDRARNDEISRQAQRGEREYDVEFRVVWPNGSIHYLKAYGQFVRDENGRPLRMTGVNYDITDLKEAENEITELNHNLEARVAERTAQLEAANKELEAFSYSVSHDLRTPLRAIDGFSKILLEDYRDRLDDEGRRLLGVVRDNTNRMSQLIDDILKFSRTGRMEMTFADIDMEKLARDVFAELQPNVDSGKLQLEIEHLIPAQGDSAMLRQVFVNLLTNAIKFSRDRIPAVIKVGCYREGGEAVYYVRDNGAGFDMQYAAKLFGVFQRLHAVTEFEGTGIGLAIVKRIVTRHGGRVWAEGKVNEGATIYFTLPTKEAAHG